MSAARRPVLLVGIDTESDNQWDAAARRTPTFANTRGLDGLHTFFARHDVRPTYLVTYPVAEDPASADTLRRLVAVAPGQKRYWVQLATIENSIGKESEALASIGIAHDAGKMFAAQEAEDALFGK